MVCFDGASISLSSFLIGLKKQAFSSSTAGCLASLIPNQLGPILVYRRPDVENAVSAIPGQKINVWSEQMMWEDSRLPPLKYVVKLASESFVFGQPL